MEIPAPVMAKVRARGWSDELIARITESVARPDQVSNLASTTLTEEKINGWLDFLERDPENPFVQAPLNILSTKSELGMHAKPGPEGLRIKVIKEGESHGQGVGYLDDGTMVVVDNARRLIGKSLDVLVTSVLQTTAGRMIFTRPKEEVEREAV